MTYRNDPIRAFLRMPSIHEFTDNEIATMLARFGDPDGNHPVNATNLARAVIESDGDLMVPFGRRVKAEFVVNAPNPSWRGIDVLPGMVMPARRILSTYEVEL